MRISFDIRIFNVDLLLLYIWWHVMGNKIHILYGALCYELGKTYWWNSNLISAYHRRINFIKTRQPVTDYKNTIIYLIINFITSAGKLLFLEVLNHDKFETTVCAQETKLCPSSACNKTTTKRKLHVFAIVLSYISNVIYQKRGKLTPI